MYSNANWLFENAVELCQQLSSLNSTSPVAQRACLASVVFAALSVEAFINELQALAAQNVRESDPGWVKALAEILEEAEESRTSIEIKYQLAKFVLTGQPFDKGRKPFQNFALLIELRNFVVHVKPGEAVQTQVGGSAKSDWQTKENKATKMIERLETARAISSTDNFLQHLIPPGDLVRVVSNPHAEIRIKGVARFACQAAAGMVNQMLDSMPSSSRLRSLAESIYRKDFSRKT